MEIVSEMLFLVLCRKENVCSVILVEIIIDQLLARFYTPFPV